MPSRPQPPPGSPLAWLLLINTLFWGGLFGSAVLVHGLATRQKPSPEPRPRLGAPLAPEVGQLLRAQPMLQAGPPAPGQVGPDAASLQLLGSSGATQVAAAPSLARAHQPIGPAVLSAAWAAAQEDALPAPLARQLQGADALGGEISLASLNEPKVLPAARAERLNWQRSGNLLSPLPLHWQNRLRQETAGGPPIQRADLVRVPVAQLQQREEVAVLIDAEGTAQSLNVPLQQPVRAAVEAWASRQQPADAGGLRAVVIAAEPLPEVVAANAAQSTVEAIVVPITSESSASEGVSGG